MTTTLNQEDLDRVAGMSSRKAAETLGVGKTTVNKYREIARMNGGSLPAPPAPEERVATSKTSVETRTDGSLTVETTGEVPQTKDQIDQAMAARGFDPELYDFTYRFSEWEAQSLGGEVIKMYAARAGATLKRESKYKDALDVTELFETVSKWEFTPVVGNEATWDMVIAFADTQFGKTDVNGGTPETISQVMASVNGAIEIMEEAKPYHVLFADLGDGLENFNNTAQQRETNDLDLTEQVRVLRRVQAECLRMIKPHCSLLTHASVPSNHGQVRVGFQQQASTPANDWGIEVSHQLEDVFTESGHNGIRFARPETKHDLSLLVEMYNTSRVGLTHGDQSSQDQMGAWWMKQAFGWQNPIRDADFLLYGHHHNQKLEEIYEGRWAIGCASSDRGSAWYTSRTGRSATSGITTFLTANHKFWNLQVV